MSQAGATTISTPTTENAVVVEDTNSETPITTSAPTKVVEVPKVTTPNVKIVKSAPTVTVQASAVSPTPGNKDNIILVVNKVDSAGGNVTSPGEVKMVSKPLTIVGSQVSASGTTILKAGTVAGKTIVKVQKAGAQGTATVVGKRNIVVAARPGGGNQIITCAPVAQQPSTPVILTQKVASGGIVTSPVVSTGANATIANVLGGSKIVTTASPASPTLPQQKLQDVRVDNWGNYCLQRLQNMYDKGDYCDLTLRFHSSQEIKVHRVVVNLCTEYFSNLEKLYGLNEGTLILPKDVEFPTMQTIIRFFYTGKLEVRGAQFTDIYRTVKMMNITILVKLLEAHSRKPATQVKKEAGRSVVLKQAVDLKGQKSQVQIQVASGSGQSHPTSPVIAVAGSKTLQVATPGVKLPPGVKTKTVLARLQPHSHKTASQMASKTTPKKLPIWKERKTPATPDPPPQLEKWQIKEEEPARPTRFEWGDPDDFMDPFMSTSTLNTNHALMEKQKEKHSVRKAEDIFDTVKSHTQTHSGVKRAQPEADSPSDIDTPSPSSEPPAAKIPRLEQETEDSILPTLDSSTDENVENSEGALIIPEEVLESENIPTATVSTPELKAFEKKPVPILKPALKTKTSGSPEGKSKDASPVKTVRFAPDVEKEDDGKTTATATTATPITSTTSAPEIPTPTLTTANATVVISTAPTTTISSTVLPSTSTATSTATAVVASASSTKTEPNVTVSGESGDLMNHSKIISEVLRKFPDLVKDNKNIRLKIVKQKPTENATAGTSSKETKSKVAYIVLKSTGTGDGTASTVLKKSPGQSSTSKFWDNEKAQKKPSPAENTTGPWLCETCGDGENSALQFDTYYNFRRHLVDVHAERIDARICEYCGQKASKRNLLLYHLYTKHGVQPPKNCTFPHCDRCDYVALSESLLNKHKQNHDVNKEFSCNICNASFKSNSALQSHMSANLHRNKDTKVYECPYCRKPFVRNINLKAHIRSLHRDVARIEEMEDPRLPPDESLKLFASTGARRRQFPSILAGARSAANAGVVEFVTADSFTDGQTVSYVTADGQPIEIIDPSALTSLPLTLVSSGEDGMTAMSAPITTAVGVESQTTSTTAEYVTSVSQDSQAMYVMDSTQGAMEIDMSNMGLTVGPDGSVVFDGDDGSQNFIVQDMQGNQFRRITGIDESGKPVVFLQMIHEAAHVGMTPSLIDENMRVDGTPANSQMFVSSAGMQIPVSSDGTSGQQVIFASASGDGTILEMVPSDGSSHQVVMSEAVLTSHGQQLDEQQQQHLQLVQHESAATMQEVMHEQMGQPVQELHLVLDQQENRSESHEQQTGQQEDMEIVEVQQSADSYNEIELGGIQQLEHQEGSIVHHETSGNGEEHHVSEHDNINDAETQQIEIDENSQQLQIDEGNQSHTLEMHSQDTQVVTEESLEESIELVEGQTLTLIEDEDGTQTLKVGDSGVEEVSS